MMNDYVTKIGVYGMGGVGKTTTMKYSHNQLLKEKGKFDDVHWVTVSKAFVITNLQSDIAKVLDLPLREDEEVTKRATNYMQCSTDRKTMPLDMTCTVLTPELEEIAAKIAKECPCLLLAIVTLPGSLRGLEGTRKWRNALNELISLTKDACDVVSKVFEQLKFSYSRLENKVLQDCFLYYSLYPKDRFITVNELINYWIAEELIVDVDSVEAQLDNGQGSRCIRKTNK
ncbi:hypothetical protein C3L33_23415, partial [Rhododendron williamsianum]